MLRGGFTQEELDPKLLDIVCNVLESSLKCGNGLLGFGEITYLCKARHSNENLQAPHLAADADDTARAVMVLKSLERSTSLKPLVNEFYANSHFKTYPFERNPSFTTNCNALAGLLTADCMNADFAPQIRAVSSFLCDSWWDNDGLIIDKWVSNF